MDNVRRKYNDEEIRLVDAWQGKWKVDGRRGRVDGAGGQRKMVNCKNQRERNG